MTNIPNNPKTTEKVLASEFPISKTAAITIKIIPTNSAIFWNITLHMLISPRTLYRLSLERLSLCHNWREWVCPAYFSARIIRFSAVGKQISV
jgi:hypothetical protein